MDISKEAQELVSIEETLQRVWGYEALRPSQKQVVTGLLQGKDSLAIMATGGGKSICFQLPALLKQGLTVVISPLLALMEDQVKDLRSRDLPAACLHSNLSRLERKQVLQNLSQLRLLYVSPETLLSQPVWEKLTDRQLPITGLMLDEAHCLVQWGDTFRPSYRRLGVVRSALERIHGDRLALAAFTATADPEATQELSQCLEMRQPQLIRTSPYRPHLSLAVKIAWSNVDRKSKLLKFIGDRRGQSGLIYVRSRRDAEDLAQWLQGKGWSTAAYHGGLPPLERRHLEQQWLTNQFPFVICTSAFGLGINKPDTRWVLHFHPPLTLSEYIQEIGRAGRDDRPAEALMLVSEPTGWLDNGDRQRINFFCEQQQQVQQRAIATIMKLPRQGQVSNLSNDEAIALGLLHRVGHLHWDDPFHYKISNLPNQIQAIHKILQTKLNMQSGVQEAIEQMQAYIRLHKPTNRDRWAFLLNIYGFEQESKILLRSKS